VLTRLARLKITLDDLREDARDLAARVDDPEQMGTYVRSGATALERLLRRLALPGVSASAGLYKLIEGLRTHGLSDSSARALHDLRTAANADKHDAQTYQDWHETERVLRNARAALNELDQLPLGPLHEPSDRPHEREFVVATYDYFHTGEAEFYVLPNVSTTTPPIEIFQMDYKHEGDALEALELSGDLRWGEQVIADGLWRRLAEDSEFYRAGLFSGTYRDLVAAFAPHQHGRALLPGLERSSNLSSVRAGVLMALVDLVYDAPSEARELDLTRLLDHAGTDYALSREHPLVRRVGEQTLALIEHMPPDVRAGLKGPQWRTPADLTIQGAHAIAKDPDLGITVRDDGTIMISEDREGRA
jgi:hypothetical protein